MTNALILLFVSPLRVELRELHAVERRDVVAIVHDEPVRIVGRVDGLRLAAVELLPLFHVPSPLPIESTSLHLAPARSRRPGRAMPIHSGAQSSAPASAARALSGVLFCCDKCAAMMCCRRDVSSAREQRGRGLVVQMPEAPGDALLERTRVVAVRQHVEVVVAFEHQRVAAGQARFDVAASMMPMSVSTPRRCAPSPTTNCTGSRASCGTGKRPDLERRRWRTRRGCRSRTRASMPSKRSPTIVERAERQPHGNAVARRERRHAADMIGVLVGDEDRA